MFAPQTPPPSLPPDVPVGHSWRGWFAGGLLLWAASAGVTFWTGNTYLLPTVVLLGSFLVPGCFVLWAHERFGQDIGTERIFACFAVGGVIGVLGASLLEYYLLRSASVWLYAGVGLIEEAVKGLALVLLTRRAQGMGMRQGMVLGAAVGHGFAAFESAGYAFNAVLGDHGLSLRALLSTEILRGVLAPVGHGLWTTILGGVLFAARRDDRFRITWPVVLTYLGVSALHMYWDSTSAIAVWLTRGITQHDWRGGILNNGYIPHPTSAQVVLETGLTWTGLISCGVIGLLWLQTLVDHARHTPAPFTPRPAPPPSIPLV